MPTIINYSAAKINRSKSGTNQYEIYGDNV